MRRTFSALAPAILAAHASAGVVTYEFTGELYRADFLTGVFVGLEPGDAFTVTINVDAMLAPMTDEPTRRRWDDAVILGFVVEFDDRTLIYRDPNEAEGVDGEVVIEDNFDGEGTLRDSFFARARRDFGNAWIDYGSEMFDPPGGMIDSISGLDLPTEADLDPARWEHAELRMGNNLSIQGTVFLARIIPAPSAALALGMGAPLVMRRRRRPLGI
ncbi:MAG: hypothetical protein RBS39_07975 [Phycisphaerales bacterium]|nr:hypothetical protein [Phycisphaerales bacterium]